MRLKTKFQDVDFKLGEVVDAGTYYGGSCEIKILACTSQGKPRVFDYDSLASMREKWEDVPEEPKEYWYIEPDGSIVQNHKPTYVNHLLDGLKSIGNYFESEEEATRAVEKLEAWKRLKDRGFRLNHWKEAQLRPNMSCVAITGNIKVDEEVKADLDLLFPGDGE